MTDEEIIDNLHREIAMLQTKVFRQEHENIALATANSELRSELMRIKNRVREINSLPWSTDTVDALADFVEDWQ